MNKRIFKQLAILTSVVAFLIIIFILADAHRSRAALIPTQLITDKNLLSELDITQGLIYQFEDSLVLNEYSALIPEYLNLDSLNNLENFVEWLHKTTTLQFLR